MVPIVQANYFKLLWIATPGRVSKSHDLDGEDSADAGPQIFERLNIFTLIMEMGGARSQKYATTCPRMQES